MYPTSPAARLSTGFISGAKMPTSTGSTVDSVAISWSVSVRLNLPSTTRR